MYLLFWDSLGNTNLVKLLVKAKAQVDCRNSKSKQTPLHLAVANRGKGFWKFQVRDLTVEFSESNRLSANISWIVSIVIGVYKDFLYKLAKCPTFQYCEGHYS